MERTKRTFSNVIFSFIRISIEMVIPFILRTILLKILGEKYLGLNNLFHSILNVMSMAELGFGSALSYNMYKAIAEDNNSKVCALLKLYRTIYILIGISILIIGLMIIPLLEVLMNGTAPKDINITFVYIIYLLEIVSNFVFFSHKTALINALQRSDQINIITSIIQLFFYALRIVLLILFKNYYIFIIFIPISVLISRMVIALYASKKYPNYFCYGFITKEEKNSIVDMVKDLSFHRFGDAITSSIGEIIISSSFGLTTLAIYGNYKYVISSVLSLLNAIMNAIVPSLGNSLLTETKEKNYSVFKRLNSINQWLMCWCTVCIFCTTQHFMTIWVGSELMESYTFVSILCIYFYTQECRKIMQVYKSAGGIWKKDRMRPFISGMIVILLSYIFIRIFKMNSAGSILSIVLCSLLIDIPWETSTVFNIYFNDKEKEYYYSWIKNIVVTIVSIFICYSICNIFSSITVLSFIIKLLICFFITNLIYGLSYKNNKEFNDNIKMLISFFSKYFIS